MNLYKKVYIEVALKIRVFFNRILNDNFGKGKIPLTKKSLRKAKKTGFNAKIKQ